MQFYSITDRGKIRTHNEDCCFSKQTEDFTILILADGMGGHKGGEIASSTAIEKASSYLEENLQKKLIPAQIYSALSEAVKRANEAVYSVSEKEADLSGMGTTLDICIVTGDCAYIAHIGDSRVYKIAPQKKITPLTKDHSLIEYMIETGTITREEAANHPQKHIITRALGTEKNAEADIFQTKLKKNDILLLCSDGLTNMLSDEEILYEIGKSSPEEGAQRLVKLANDAGGTDNITVIVAQHQN